MIAAESRHREQKSYTAHGKRTKSSNEESYHPKTLRYTCCRYVVRYEVCCIQHPISKYNEATGPSPAPRKFNKSVGGGQSGEITHFS